MRRKAGGFNIETLGGTGEKVSVSKWTYFWEYFLYSSYITIKSCLQHSLHSFGSFPLFPSLFFLSLLFLFLSFTFKFTQLLECLQLILHQVFQGHKSAYRKAISWMMIDIRVADQDASAIIGKQNRWQFYQQKQNYVRTICSAQIRFTWIYISYNNYFGSPIKEWHYLYTVSWEVP